MQPKERDRSVRTDTNAHIPSLPRISGSIQSSVGSEMRLVHGPQQHRRRTNSQNMRLITRPPTPSIDQLKYTRRVAGGPLARLLQVVLQSAAIQKPSRDETCHSVKCKWISVVKASRIKRTRCLTTAIKPINCISRITKARFYNSGQQRQC